MTLTDRISRLSGAQRRLLAERLGLGARAERGRLVAFVVPAPGADPSPAALRDWLKARLPGHMIPDMVAPVDVLPTLPNGKIDRRALRDRPLDPQPDTPRDTTGPRTEAERKLAAIWTELLSIDPIGVTDDFFELGGDSIVAIRLVSRARQEGLQIAPADIAEAPTIEALARVASASDAAGPAPAPDETAFPAAEMDADEVADFLDALDAETGEDER